MFFSFFLLLLFVSGFRHKTPIALIILYFRSVCQGVLEKIFNLFHMSRNTEKFYKIRQKWYNNFVVGFFRREGGGSCELHSIFFDLRRGKCGQQLHKQVVRREKQARQLARIRKNPRLHPRVLSFACHCEHIVSFLMLTLYTLIFRLSRVLPRIDKIRQRWYNYFRCQLPKCGVIRHRGRWNLCRT